MQSIIPSYTCLNRGTRAVNFQIPNWKYPHLLLKHISHLIHNGRQLSIQANIALESVATVHAYIQGTLKSI
jgi:hypothetical protein